MVANFFGIRPYGKCLGALSEDLRGSIFETIITDFQPGLRRHFG